MFKCMRNIVLAACALTVCSVIVADQAAARTLRGRTLSFGHRAQNPKTWAGVNKSSPAAVRSFLTPYQPTNNSAGLYLPWATVQPYGAKMRGTPAARAVCALNPACAVPPPSDRRLKRDVVLLSRLDNGLGLYRFRYLWSDERYVGVMAQEVKRVVPAAVARDEAGYLHVDYAQLGLQLRTWSEWVGSQ